MADIRKRTGKKGTTYQVRYPSKATASGYAFKTFGSLKEARAFREDSIARAHSSPRNPEFRTIQQAIQKWLEICKFEGRNGRDPVSKATMQDYEYRASIMREYAWEKELHELEARDVVAFRSWLLRNYSRDQAKKVLSAFHSVVLEMVTQGVLSNDPATNVTIQQSRYYEPVAIPTIDEFQAMLRAADTLANHRNQSIAKPWQRYRPMIYLAADSGMRPQEYLAFPLAGLSDKGVQVLQAVDRSNKIGPPKTAAGRRYIPVGQDTLELIRHYQTRHPSLKRDSLLFPGRAGTHQSYTNFYRRGWRALMAQAGLMDDTMHGEPPTPKYSPYTLRHFYASMLIANNKDLKTIQTRMGHADITTTLNIYGHLIRKKQDEEKDEDSGVIAGILQSHCGESVASLS